MTSTGGVILRLRDRGFWLRRLMLEESLRLLLYPTAAGLPVPPIRLIWDVLAVQPRGQTAFWYVRSGREAAEMIRALLFNNGIDGIDGDILDFGCGSGRVIRWFRAHPAAVVGSDYNPTLIDWCRKHLTGLAFNVNGLDPPLPYDDGRFALIYAFSVFTHLDEARQVAWLSELARVTAASGHIVVTTHGTRFLGGLVGDGRSRFAANETVVSSRGEVGSNRFGTFQSEQNFRRLAAAAGLEVMEYLPWGSCVTGGQDLWLLSHP